jgi:exosortase A
MTFLGFTFRDASPPVAAAGPTAAQSHRRIAIALVGLGWIGLLAIFHDTAAAMVRTWYGAAAYNHGFLIFPIVGLLIWERRHSLARLRPRPSALGLAMLAGGAILWLMGQFSHVLFVREVALVAMLQAMWLAVLGPAMTRAAFFPLFYMYFAIPFGYELVPRMQDFTAAFATRALQLSGIAVLKNGIFIATPTGLFEVAEACSGLRFLIAMVALGVLFTNMAYKSWWRRGLFLALAIVVPVIANGIRAYGIIMLAYLTDNRFAAGVDHIVYGWIFFTLVMLVLLGIGVTFQDRPRLGWTGPGPRLEETPVAAPPHAGALVAMAFAALLIAGAAPAFDAYIERSTEGPAAVTLAPPEVAAPWRRVAGTNDSWQPRFVGVDAQIAETYVSQAQRVVHLYIGYYAHQREGKKLVAYGNDIAGRKVWTRASGGGATVSIEGKPVTVSSSRLVSRPGHERLVWHWYWIGGRFTANPYVAKLLELKQKLVGGSPGAAVIAVGGDIEGSQSSTAAVLQDFLDHLRLTGVSLGAGTRARRG